MISRRVLLSGALAAAALPALADGPASSIRPERRPTRGQGISAGPAAGALIAAANLGGAVGFVVADAATGAVLEAVEPDLGLPPASTAKALTSLFALERLGPGHRFATSLIATGPVSGGRLQGDLVLAGSGDPTLDTDDLGDLAAQLAAAGVRSVAGRFLVWDRALPAIDQIAADQPDHVGYNPAISGLNLNYNRVHFEWKRAGGNWGVAMDARGERFVPPVRMARMTVVERDQPLFTYLRRDAQEDWTVASTALGQGGSRWLPVRRPGLYAGEVFQTLARAQGIDLPAASQVGVLPKGRVLAQHHTDTLPDMLREMLRFSTNLTAEVLGLTASRSDRLAASAAQMSGWAKDRFGAAGRLVDHSGLGGASRISAADMVRALVASQATTTGRLLPGLLRDFGMRDADGREVASPIRVMAKTGTLNFVSALVGHIVPPAGRPLVFAIFCADAQRRDRLAEAEREQPPGGKAWTSRARKLQGQLVARWAGAYC